MDRHEHPFVRNQRYYEERRHNYPYEYLAPPFNKSRLRPSNFARAYPNIMFMSMPLKEGTRWCFESVADLDIFIAWKDSVSK